MFLYQKDSRSDIKPCENIFATSPSKEPDPYNIRCIGDEYDHTDYPSIDYLERHAETIPTTPRTVP